MNGLAATVRARVGEQCCSTRCRRGGCSISMAQLPSTSHVLVDMDCDALEVAGGRRCDCVFVGDSAEQAWVAPIELKSGALRGQEVAAQLQAGADAAGAWLPAGAAFTLAPVLAHNGIHRTQRDRLRRARIRLHGRNAQPVLIHCGAPLRDALAAA